MIPKEVEEKSPSVSSRELPLGANVEMDASFPTAGRECRRRAVAGTVRQRDT